MPRTLPPRAGRRSRRDALPGSDGGLRHYPAQPQDNATFTRLTRNDSHDDWLKRGIRSDAADLIVSRI